MANGDVNDTWTVCTIAQDLATVQVQRSALEACGIPTLVPDETTAGLAWHLGQALGGIRLMVPASLVAAAKEILNGRGDAPVPELDTSAPDSTDAATDMSAGDRLAHRAFKVAVVGTLLVVVLPYALILTWQALRRRRLSSWGKRRLGFVFGIATLWLAGFALILRLGLTPAWPLSSGCGATPGLRPTSAIPVSPIKPPNR